MELDGISFATRGFFRRNGAPDHIPPNHLIPISMFDEKDVMFHMIDVSYR
jgi:hypothetical protein